MKRIAVLLSVALCLSSASAMVVNGSMDFPITNPAQTNGANAFVPTDWAAVPRNDGNGLETPDIFAVNTVLLNFAWDSSQDGETFVHGAATGSGGIGIQEGITQLITGLTSGLTYAVGFEQSISYSDLSPVGSPGYWEVTFGGVTLNSASMTTPLTSTPFGWQNQSLSFLATASEMDLSFRAASGDPINPRIDLGLDGVTLAIAPIPAAVWLFGSALGLLGWIRRKKA